MDGVTAIMITGKHPSRRPLAQASIRAFQRQTYPAKQLVIINSGELLAPGFDMTGIREVWSGVYEHLDLGQLRNVGLEHADSPWIAQWDDDDWHHEDYLQFMMDRRCANGAVVLTHQIRYSFRSRSSFVFHQGRGIEGTVLHAKTETRYRSVARKEDSYFLKDGFKGRLTAITNADRPELYLRFHHGANTWDDRHIMGVLATATDVRKLEQTQAIYLRRVLQEHYSRI